MLKSEYKKFDKREIELEIVKNGKAIKKQRIYWMLIGTGLGIGVCKLLNFITGNLN